MPVLSYQTTCQSEDILFRRMKKRLNSHQVELPPQSASSTLALTFPAG
jgi:hypothetical protein